MKLAENIKLTLFLLSIIWAVFIIDIFLPYDLRRFGIIPRNTDGLWGIIMAPFIHSGLYHIIANSSALIVLLIASLSYSRKCTIMALLIIIFGSGLFVWLFGWSHTIHVGASGVIFGLIGFLLFSGIFRMDLKSLFFSVIVFVLYGGTLVSLLKYQPGISWSGHAFGFVSGIFAAWTTKNVQNT